MYEYVAKSVVKPYKAYCQSLLNSLKDNLKKKEGISVEIKLIGSGASNMVTRNGKEPFDLDYNIVINSVPDSYLKAPGKLKDVVRKLLDSLINEKFSYGQDSTSSITYILHSLNNKTVEFRMDFALIRKDNSTTFRLIHDKKQDSYIWNELPNYGLIPKKVDQIRKNGKMNELKALYLQLKNHYLSRSDRNHPSFVIYAEAVEDIYQQCKALEENDMSNENQQEKFNAGKETMFNEIRVLGEMSDRERYLYFNNEEPRYGLTLSLETCLKKYSMTEIERAVNQYLTDNLRLGDIIIRKEDGLEYIVAKCTCDMPRAKKYKCLSLLEDEWFELSDITEIKKTKKHIDYNRLKSCVC